MNTNTAYNQHDDKSSGLFKKLWRSYEEEYQNAGIDNISLLKCIHQARQEWLSAANNFDQAEDNDLIDYYIYRMKACQVRYNYLLKKAKEMGIRGDLYDVR